MKEKIEEKVLIIGEKELIIADWQVQDYCERNTGLRTKIKHYQDMEVAK